MARDSKEQKELKIRALHEAVEVLKEESSPMNNKVTFDNVVYLANELYSEELTRKISPTSIKTPTSEEFEKIKQLIEDYRSEYKKLKTAVPKQSEAENIKLKNQIKNLVQQIVKFHDEKILLVEQLSLKDSAIQNLKNERTRLLDEIKELRISNGN
jgi:cobalamin biosynthesis Co2+ chelatase CbiK